MENKEIVEESIKALKHMLDPFLYAVKYKDKMDITGETYNIPMALLEIAKALNRIADKMETNESNA